MDCRCILLLLLGWTMAKPQLDFSSDSRDFGELLTAGSGPGGVRVPYSPCSPTFDYRGWRGQVVGVAQISPPRRSSLNEPIKILITLRLDAHLPNQYVGSLELQETKEEVFSRLERGDNRPIWYRVLFPVQNPVPSLVSIEVNGQIVCQGGSSSSNGPSTILKLDHSLFPGSSGLSSENPSWQQPTNQNTGGQQPANQNTVWQQGQNSVNQPWQQPSRPTAVAVPTNPPWQQPVQPVQTVQPVQQPVAPATPDQSIQHTIGQDNTHIQCGVAIKIKPLVQHGSPSEQGDWPWLAAIFVKTSVGQDFQCGGSLVSTSHVVTAAHCVKDPNKAALTADSITIILGKFNLRKTEPSNQARDASRVVMHPQYGGGKYDYDVAIIFLEYPVEFTAMVRPVCIWPSSDPNLEGIINQKGTVVGWGRDEQGNRISDVPKEVRMPLVTQEECLRSHHNFYYLTSENTFCAGGRDGSGPCNGDSGGGMYFPEKTSGGSTRWMLRGVVSLSLQDDSTRMCDLSNYIVFTDVAKFSSWISGIIRN